MLVRLVAIITEALLVTVLAVVLAWTAWRLLAPIDVAERAEGRSAHLQRQPVDRSLVSRLDIFWSNARSSASMDNRGWTLHGVRASPDPDLGAAILSREGLDQRSYFVGDEVAPGVVLEAVGIDHVVLGQGNSIIELYIDSGRAVAPARQAATPLNPGGSAAQSDLGQLFAALAPRLEGGMLTGLVVSGSEAERYGLRAGDVILAVNNERPDTLAALADLPARLPPAGPYQLRLERDGAETLVTID